MLRRALASSRYIVAIAVVGTCLASVALMLYQTAAVVDVVVHVASEAIRDGAISPRISKVLATGLLEAIDVFLIAIAAYIISLGLYVLFVDDTLPVPRWLQIHDFEDLKNHLVSVLIAVFAVLFLREAVARAADLDLLWLGVTMAVMIAALTLYLSMKGAQRK